MHVTAKAKASLPILQRARPRWWWASLQLTAIAAHRPLILLIGPTRAVASAASVLFTCGLVAVAANAVYLLLLGMRAPGWKALAWTTVGALLFWHSSGLGTDLSVPSWLLQAVLFAVVLLATGRYSHLRYMRIGLLAGSLTLFATIATNALVSAVTTPPPVVGVQQPVGELELRSFPDIYLIVLDGYARSDVIERIFEHDNSPFQSALADYGFEVYSEAKANYPITHFSIPSMLNMSYMHHGDETISNSDLGNLADSISGENAVVRTLKANGYQYVHGETTTQYNHCGDLVDVCLEGPFLDLTMYRLLQNTPIGGLFYSETGDPATWLNQTRIDQMSDWNSVEADLPQGPIFTFLHLILPHPPLFLDKDCKIRLDPDLRGSEMIRDDIPADLQPKRLAAWVEQVECANETVIDFVEQLDDDALVIVTSDHGSDAGYRLFGDVAQYTAEDLAERMPTFTAARLPDPCRNTVPENVALVNLFRYVLACLSDEAPDPLPDRTFVASFGGYVIEVKYPR
jgi:hypothetical protein